MRLLRLEEGEELSLHEFIGSNIPEYAILSHTWGADNEEVSFKDLLDGTWKSKEGCHKILACGAQANEDGLTFFWVDTCCIDKSSSSELGESINSMFEWYRNAQVCYVYLVDLHADAAVELELTKCRWFTRGWTLQELVAPKHIKFYNLWWRYVGSNFDLKNIISAHTEIPERLLCGDMKLFEASVAQRMCWAACRQTTRIEDLAYCLLGIFQVNMPLIYGEGMRAFRRLQEEIIKHNNDLTIFAWINGAPHDRFIGLFAPSPAAFAECSRIRPFLDDFANFSVTNKGLLLTGDIPLRVANFASTSGQIETLYLFCVGTRYDSFDLNTASRRCDGGVYLRKIGPKVFCRDGVLPIAGFWAELEEVDMLKITEIYILLDPTVATRHMSISFQNHSLHVPFYENFQLDSAIPEVLWDHNARIFLRPGRQYGSIYSTVLAMLFTVWANGIGSSLIVLCDYRKRLPIVKLLNPAQHERESAVLFQYKNREDGLAWDELEVIAPNFFNALSTSLTVRIGNKEFQISVGTDQAFIHCLIRRLQVHSLALCITPKPNFSH